MNRPANIHFLTEQENGCLELLLQAQDIFDKICEESPQSPTDSYNFGHYLDAARSAILLRGARRLDPDNLLLKHRDSITNLDKEKNAQQLHSMLIPEIQTDESKNPQDDKAKELLTKYASEPSLLTEGLAALVANRAREIDPKTTTAICRTIPDLLSKIDDHLSRIESEIDAIREDV